MSDQKDSKQQQLQQNGQNPEKDPISQSDNTDEAAKSLEEKKQIYEDLTNDLKNEESKDAEDADEKSVFVKNVDYSADPKELKEHFSECGDIKRITIPVDKLTNQSKGYAYVEFETKEGAMMAKRLNESLFKGRQITVIPKRKNVPGRGRGARGGKNPMLQIAGMLQMAFMGRGRGRGRGGFKPY